MRASRFIPGSIAFVLAALLPVTAVAQNSPATAVYPSCPEGAVSVYFTSGDIGASTQTLAILGRIGEVVQACRPDHVDLVAYVNPPVEGDGALSLSLGRLDLVAKELSAAGVPLPVLRTATKHVAERGAGGLIQIDIVMRRSGETLPAEREAAPVAPRTLLRGDPV
jgi:hypothetical protein